MNRVESVPLPEDPNRFRSADDDDSRLVPGGNWCCGVVVATASPRKNSNKNPNKLH